MTAAATWVAPVNRLHRLAGSGWVLLAGLSPAAAVPTVLPLFGGGGLGWLLAAVAIPATAAAASTVLPDRHPLHALADSGWTRLVVAAGGVAALLAAVPPGAQGDGALTGLGSGLDRLFTTALPAAPRGPELGVAMVAVAAGAGAAAELARRPRAKAGWWPLVPTVVVYLAALVVGAGGQAAPAWGAIPVVGAGVLVAVAARPPGRRVVATLATVAVVVGVALPLGTHLPGAGRRAPYDVRAAVAPPPRPASQLSLLSSYAAIYDGPIQTAFTVHTDGADPHQLNWRLATFDHFTGTGWTSTDAFQRAGLVLPPGPGMAVRASTVSAQVDLAAPGAGAGAYLPVPGRPTSVSVDGLAISVPDGVLAVPAGRASPRRYVVRAVVASPTAPQLLGAAAVPGSDPGSPPLPPSVVSVASAIVAHAGPSPFSRLTAITTFLTGPGFVRHPPGGSPIGSGSYQVDQLLADHDGSAEQYAAAFALLARAVGFDTRLAVGYTGGTASGGDSATFTSRDLTVWPEVQLRGMGWVAFPVVPGTTGTGKPGSGGPDATGGAASPLSQALAHQRAVNASPSPSSPSGPGGQVQAAAHGGGPGWPVVVALAAGTVLFVALAVLAGLAAARGRRGRRQRGCADNQGRVIGAWESVVDRLAALGLPVPPSLTPDEVASVAGAALGPSCAGPVARLGPLADAARFDRRYPPTDATAAAAWAEADSFGEALRRSVPWPRRLGAAVSPAPWLRNARGSRVISEPARARGPS